MMIYTQNSKGEIMDPIMPQKDSYSLEVQKGKSYRWCACGRSKEQPLCDNSHSNTGIKPIRFTAEESETIYLCGCKRSSDKPFCDMTHEKI